MPNSFDFVCLFNSLVMLVYAARVLRLFHSLVMKDDTKPLLLMIRIHVNQ